MVFGACGDSSSEAQISSSCFDCFFYYFFSSFFINGSAYSAGPLSACLRFFYISSSIAALLSGLISTSPSASFSAGSTAARQTAMAKSAS